MRPESTRQRKDQYTPRWRHFHPQATLFMRNPFNEDILFQVADEHNRPFQYRLPAGAVCELPGGAVATLGLKTVIDRMIGETKTDAVRIWEPSVRASYEDKIIVRVKEAPRSATEDGPGGIVDLASTEEEDTETTDAADSKPNKEVAFPGLKNKAPKPAPATTQPQLPPAPARRGTPRGDEKNANSVAAIAGASLGAADQIIDET